MSNISDAFVVERKHWDKLQEKYTIYCMKGESDEVWVGDTERIIKCLISYLQETEDDVISRLDNSDIDNVIHMNDEVFWVEK